MIAILLACVIGFVGTFVALFEYGFLIALLGAALGGSTLAGGVAVVIASRAAKRRQSVADKLRRTDAATSTVQSR